MKKLNLIIILLLATFLLTTNSHGQTPKKSWMEFMRANLAIEFCKDGSYFRQCFNINKTQCLKTAKKVVSMCLDMHSSSFPATFDQASGSEYGRNVGACSGTEYENELVSKKFKNKQICYDAKHWTK